MSDYTESIQWVSNEYRGKLHSVLLILCASDIFLDLNGSGIEVLEKPPSPLEFSRLVHISRPVIIKGTSSFFLKKHTT